MSLYKELNYTSKIREISGVQFSIIGPEEIKRRSVAHITKTILYDANGDPELGGLMDPRMGVIDHGKICPTDNLDNRFCPGYFGHIELARPVFHVQFIQIIIKILKCVCIRCSKLLIDINDADIRKNLAIMTGKKRWSYILDLCSKVKICGTNTDCGCGAIQPTKYIKEGLAKLYADWKDKSSSVELADEDKKQLLTSEYILKLFRRISEADCEALGLSNKWCRPEWLICTILAVPPPTVRPSVKQHSNNQRSEDDITHKLIDIIKTNNHLKKKLDSEKSAETTVEEWSQVLQYHVATFVDNEIPNVNAAVHRSGRTLKTLRQRLKGKEGRIRGNLMGKRVDFSSRSVITPDPNIKIDELGVPIKIAKNLTFPEIVTKYNKNILYTYVRNGPSKHPGAKSIKRKRDNLMTSLHHVDTMSIVLEEGDVVNRHLIDGDIVLFNRQPSLHKMSMMAHRVRVMPYSTFRLNVSVTKPYNADFDGDEMNMHVPQSLQTKVELKLIASVPLQIISPREHTPVISPVQDTMLGINRLTNDNVYFTKKELMNILIYVNEFSGIFPEPEIEEPVPKWSGRQLVSMILPNNINLNMKTKKYDSSNPNVLEHVIIKEGQLLQGRIDKKVMNAGSKGLLHIIFNDYGPKVAQQFLDNIQNIVTKFLVNTGFSVGISDLIADDATMTKIEDAIISKKKDVNTIIQNIHQRTFDSLNSDDIKSMGNASITNNTEFEGAINRILNQATGEVGSIGLKSLDKNNRMTNMVSSGSKGSEINISQMIACVGQQNVDAKRIPHGYGNRTLPHYQKYDESPDSRGFVENSFIKGLNPQEFFFHAMGGREGLIDTAVKTSETGYIQRKLIKAMEDLKITHDLSVRNALGNIIQFLYGEDGMDYSKIEVQHLEYFSNSYEEIRANHLFRPNEKWSTIITKKSLEDMKATKDWYMYLEKYFNTLENDMRMIRLYIYKNYSNNIVHYPINLNRLIINTVSQFNLNSLTVSNLNPLYVIQEVNKLSKKLYINDNNKGNILFNILLRSYLSPKPLITKHNFNKAAFDYLINQITILFNSSFVQPSEMVGAIAAQSIGEPATQMTLNTFHFAGVSSKSNVTRGVPRLKELLHISKNIKAPSLTIYLKDEYCYDPAKCKEVLNDIEFTRLKDITMSAKIFYDPDDFDTNLDEDKEFLEIYKVFNTLDNCLSNESKFILRLEFDKQKMIDKDITMENVYTKITSLPLYSNDISCLYSDDNAGKLIFRIRILKSKKSDDLNDISILKNLEKNLRDKVIIKGIDGIEKVSMRTDMDNFVENEKSFIKKEQWVLDTDGLNLLEILNHPNVNYKRTITNDIYEMYETFGIESARLLLLKEIRVVLTDAGNYVNFRHLALLCDIMTNRGDLMSIDRFGINRGNIGPLAKCSFEETTDQLFKAAIFGEMDKLTGVSSNIMMGQIAPCGTGETDILLDETKLLDINPSKEIDIDNMDDIDLLEDVDEYCDLNIGFDFNSSTIEADDLDNVPEIKLN